MVSWYQWVALGALAYCLGSLLYHLVKIIRLGKPVDLARPAGTESAGIRYSFTQGMSPLKKESAYLHLPTYAAGLFYHGGTFLSILVFLLSLGGLAFPSGLRWIVAGIVVLTSLAGLFILIKRVALPKMRSLSNPDDYLSNLLVTGFQGMTVAFLLIGAEAGCPYYLVATLLLLYMPLGKLRHLLYFFAARYQLGLFFGRRGVWR